MREARIISATTQRDGNVVPSSVHDQLERTLAERFGGYTVVLGRGGFIMASGELKTELVRVYDVAMEVHHFPALCGIAQWLAREANQECVYVRDPNGHVSFYDRGLDPAHWHYQRDVAREMYANERDIHPGDFKS